MGKNSKKTKGKNIFKVAGAKSLKAKNKAKPLKLKKVTLENKLKINDVDQQFADIGAELRQSNKFSTTPKKSEVKGNNLNSHDIVIKTIACEEKEKEALDKLSDFKM